MLRYALYARKSTLEADERQAQSIEDQQLRALDLARLQGLQVTHTLSESVSAKEEGRPVFARMVRMAQKGEIDGILAWHPDRLSRNETDAVVLTKLLRKGILKDLKFVNYHFVNSPEGIMMLQFALSQSQYYSSKLSGDVKRGMESKVQKGWFPHRAPPGYVNDKHRDQGEKTISPHPEHFALIQRAFRMVRSRQYSAAEVLRKLNGEWGYRCPQTRRGGGGPLSQSTFYRALSNPFYYGYFVEKGVLHRGSHLPMVTRREFDEVQEALGNLQAKPVKREFAYTGLMTCARCGGQVTAQLNVMPDGRRYYYYHCRDLKRICGKKSIREEYLEGEIEKLLEQVTILPEFGKWAQEEIERWKEKDWRAGLAEAAQRRTTVGEVERQLESLLSLKLRDLLSDDEYLEEKRKRLNEKANLERQAEEEAVQEQGARESMENLRIFPHPKASERSVDFMPIGLAWN